MAVGLWGCGAVGWGCETVLAVSSSLKVALKLLKAVLCVLKQLPRAGHILLRIESPELVVYA